MSKRKTVAPKPKSRWYPYRRRGMLLVLIAIALVIGVARWKIQEPRTNYHTLSELLASGKYDGYAVVQEPDRPGPYEEKGVADAPAGEPLLGSFWANGKTRRYNVPGLPGAELRVINLIPQDGGEPTYVVLKRQIRPAAPVGQSTK